VVRVRGRDRMMSRVIVAYRTRRAIPEAFDDVLGAAA
jgi:hypothetical protein